MPCSIRKGEIQNQSCHYSNAPARFHQSVEPVGLRVRPPSYIKSAGQGAGAAHAGQSTFPRARRRGRRRRGRRGEESEEERREQDKREEVGSNSEEMVRSPERGIPAWVCVATLLLLLHCASVRGGKAPFQSPHRSIPSRQEKKLTKKLQQRF